MIVPKLLSEVDVTMKVQCDQSLEDHSDLFTPTIEGLVEHVLTTVKRAGLKGQQMLRINMQVHVE